MEFSVSDILVRLYENSRWAKQTDSRREKSAVWREKSGALIISQKSSSEGVQSPGWTGMGGPVILGGGRGGGVGRGSEVDSSTAKATIQNDEKENPLKKLLESRILPEKKTTDPVTGLLYFVMEKQKMKDLELTYGGRENRISLRFKP